MFKNTVLGLALAALAASSHAVVAAGAEIHFSPSTDSVLAGDLFDVVLQGANFNFSSTGESVTAFNGGQNISFSYSFANIELLSITLDPRWNFGNSVGTINQAAGTVTGFRFGTSPATPDDNFNIATFHVKALAAGPGSLSMTAGTFVGTVNGMAAKTIAVNMQPFQVQVSAVPEPSQWAILLLGLGIVGLRLRRR